MLELSLQELKRMSGKAGIPVEYINNDELLERFLSFIDKMTEKQISILSPNVLDYYNTLVNAENKNEDIKVINDIPVSEEKKKIIEEAERKTYKRVYKKTPIRVVPTRRMTELILEYPDWNEKQVHAQLLKEGFKVATYSVTRQTKIIQFVIDAMKSLGKWKE